MVFFSAKFYSILYKTKTVFNLKNVLHFTLRVIHSKIAKFGPKMRKITTAKITTVKRYTLRTSSHIYTWNMRQFPPPQKKILACYKTAACPLSLPLFWKRIWVYRKTPQWYSMYCYMTAFPKKKQNLKLFKRTIWVNRKTPQ